MPGLKLRAFRPLTPAKPRFNPRILVVAAAKSVYKSEGMKNGNKPADRSTIDLTSDRFRTRVGLGRRLLDGADGRSSVARRYREVAALLAQDVSPDPDQLTEAQRQLIRTTAGLVILRERLDVRLIKGETNISTAKYCRIANSLRRILATIGLTRMPRDITPLRERLALEAEPAE
jgi:hypothetical protein